MGSEGKIIDASFVDVPRQRHSREENEIIKAGAVPIEFGQNAHKLGQKDTDARWTKKGQEVHYGYKNHVKANREKSKVRVRVEHIFGHMTQAMADGLKLRSIGIKRITAVVGLLNLVYNMARYEQIMRLGLV